MVSAVLLLLMAAPAPPGKLIDVGGYRVHLNCIGTGNPVVIIVGGFSFDWNLVQPEAAKFGRVCTYDVSGTAWSDPGPANPTCAGRVEEIHHLLKAANIDRPFVLVGFSTGALFARLYARDYPHDLSGMVIVDHAFLPPKAAPAPITSNPDSPPVLIFATPITAGIEDEPGYDTLPQSIRDLHRWAEPISPGRPTAELAEACNASVGSAGLGDMPLAVVSTANDSRGYADLQKRLLALSTNSRQFIANHSFHSIEISQPEIVVEAMRQVVEATRK
jgi:pimeloyl-ACP methyl ester carboxylesterase